MSADRSWARDFRWYSHGALLFVSVEINTHIQRCNRAQSRTSLNLAGLEKEIEAGLCLFSRCVTLFWDCSVAN